MTKNLSKIPRFARNDIGRFILSFTLTANNYALCIMNYALNFICSPLSSPLGSCPIDGIVFTRYLSGLENIPSL